jgi:amyloid beta precursor protein binding protein 1
MQVEPRDLGNNFLIDAAGLGAPRAKVLAGLVQELNDAVGGSWVEEAPESLLTSNPGFFAQFALIIATQVCA